MVSFLSLVGFVWLLECALVGGYVIIRWGLVGTLMIWRVRRVLDQRVREVVGRDMFEVEET